jgi:hypothetical protein
MWWKKAPRPVKPLRQELEEARASLTRQLEILRSPMRPARAPNNRAIIAELQGQLREITQVLAELDSRGE